MADSQISETTRVLYGKMYARLEKAARALEAPQPCGISTPSNVPPTYESVVAAFLEQRVKWSKPTEALYKAAVLHFLEGALPARMGAAQEAKRMLTAMARPLGDGSAYFSSEEHRRRAIEKNVEDERRRKINLEMRQQSTASARAAVIFELLNALNESRSKWKEHAALWYKSALLTGLSPGDWWNACVVDDGVGATLCVKRPPWARSAKGRPLKKLTAEQLDVVRAHIANASEHADRARFDSWFHSCRALIQTTAARIWPTRPSRPTLNASRYLLAKKTRDRLTALEVATLSIGPFASTPQTRAGHLESETSLT